MATCHFKNNFILVGKDPGYVVEACYYIAYFAKKNQVLQGMHFGPVFKC
jgi:hypothetical protein